jgi:hypothetical protein
MLTIKDFFKQLSIVLDRPGMFGIQKVEDIAIIFFTEILFNRNEALEKCSTQFSSFARKEIDENLVNVDWSKIIRLYSGSDYHSIELFKDMFNNFMKEYKGDVD